MLARFILILSSLGFLNASYLTYFFIQKTFFNNPYSICDISNTLSCSSVITSPYAQFFGLPGCTIALIVYPVLIFLAYRALCNKKPQIPFFWLSVFSGMGLVMNYILIYNEYAFIKAYCILCIFCSFVITAIFASSITGFLKSVR